MLKSNHCKQLDQKVSVDALEQAGFLPVVKMEEKKSEWRSRFNGSFTLQVQKESFFV